MAGREIVWTETAKSELKEILRFWVAKTGSRRFSQKLSKLIKEKLNVVAEHPRIGRKTSDGKARITIIREYIVFYEFTVSELIVLSIWDARRNEEGAAFEYF